MSVSVAKYENFVGGEWVGAADGKTMEVLNPATGEVIAEVPASSAKDVDRAVAAAKKALPDWLETTPGERAEILLSLAALIEEHGDELAALESQNVGKPLSYAKDEIPVGADNLRFFAGAARVLEGRSTGEYMRGYTSMIRREPLGIVGGIAPWNYPLMMAIWKIAPALAAGNVQVVKPSEQTPLTTLRFMQLAQEILPPGVLNVITGDGVPAGDALVKHPDVRLVSLTGDVSTGKLIARNASDTLKRVHLELGGKAPVLVFDDADPAQVAEAIKIGGYWNSGQDCTAASRVIAGPKIYDALLEALVPAVESLHVGDPAEGDEVEMGPVISQAQQERVLGFLERASKAKATILTGGEARPATAASSSSRRSSWTSAQDSEIVQQRGLRARSSRCSGSPTTTRRSRGRTTSATAWRRRSGPATSAAPSTPRGSSSSGRSGSTTTSRSSRRCRTAATRSPATARTSRCTRSRTTRRSST